MLRTSHCQTQETKTVKLNRTTLEYIPLKDRKKPSIKNGVMHKLIVYDNGAMIGYGFVITYPDGKMTAPELFDIAGRKLPEGWYQLTMTAEHYNVVVPRNIQ